MKDFVVGAQLYSVRKFMQNRPYIEATLKAIREMGYTTVQLSGQNRAIEDEFYADLLEKYGLKCVVTHNSLADFEDGFDALVKRHVSGLRVSSAGKMAGIRQSLAILIDGMIRQENAERPQDFVSVADSIRAIMQEIS